MSHEFASLWSMFFLLSSMYFLYSLGWSDTDKDAKGSFKKSSARLWIRQGKAIFCKIIKLWQQEKSNRFVVHGLIEMKAIIFLQEITRASELDRQRERERKLMERLDEFILYIINSTVQEIFFQMT